MQNPCNPFRLRSLLAAVLLAVATPAAAEPAIVGTACAVDGDSLRVGGFMRAGRCVGGLDVRLAGADAFEWDQTCRDRQGEDWACGAAAREATATRVRGRQVVCQRQSTGAYGRPIAVCLAAGVDLGRALVADGLAVIDPRYPSRYQAEQAAAEAAGAGGWAGTFTPPWDWRRAKKSDKTD